MSVLVPMYNRAGVIGDAIASLLAQTIDDFEIVVVDDGSSDQSIAIVEAFADRRIRIVRHGANRGIPVARNTALDAARGRYIAWLDSDDIARPERLAVQRDWLDAHPEVAMVGCAAGKIDAAGRRKRGVRIPPLAPADISAWLLFRSAFQQSSLMGRADVLQRYRYAPDFPVCEDIDMFVRLTRDGHRLANLPRVLIDRRIHPGQTVQQERAAILERKQALAAAPLAAMGMAPDRADLARHVLLGKARLAPAEIPPDLLPRAQAWLTALRARNEASGTFDRDSLRFVTSWFWLLACRAALPRLGMAAVARAALTSSLSRGVFSAPARRWLASAWRPMLSR